MLLCSLYTFLGTALLCEIRLHRFALWPLHLPASPLLSTPAADGEAMIYSGLKVDSIERFVGQDLGIGEPRHGELRGLVLIE